MSLGGKNEGWRDENERIYGLWLMDRGMGNGYMMGGKGKKLCEHKFDS